MLIKLFEFHFCLNFIFVKNRKLFFPEELSFHREKLIPGFYPQLTSFRIFLAIKSIFFDLC